MGGGIVPVWGLEAKRDGDWSPCCLGPGWVCNIVWHGVGWGQGSDLGQGWNRQRDQGRAHNLANSSLLTLSSLGNRGLGAGPSSMMAQIPSLLSSQPIILSTAMLAETAPPTTPINGEFLGSQGAATSKTANGGAGVVRGGGPTLSGTLSSLTGD